ncbi:MAG TPA: hypothetical protein VMU66_09915, partial [Gaiellales bacterium]|nr:hypothetical protein [Gaiellales bacterium]
VRVVGAVAGGAITFALILFLGLRLLSGGDGAGMAAPVAGRRLDLGSMNAAALVIPVLVVVLGVGVAAVAGFLLL